MKYLPSIEPLAIPHIARHRISNSIAKLLALTVAIATIGGCNDNRSCPNVDDAFFRAAINEFLQQKSAAYRHDSFSFIDRQRYSEAAREWVVPFRYGEDPYISIVSCRGKITSYLSSADGFRGRKNAKP